MSCLCRLIVFDDRFPDDYIPNPGGIDRLSVSMKLNSLLGNPMGQTLDKDSRNAPNEPSGGSGAADPSAIGDDTVPDSNQTLEFGAVIPQHEMGSSPAEPSVRISNPFGRYEIERCLEVNSGGQVYLARDGTLGRHVTIIVPNCEEDSPNSSVKLIESAKIAARLRHPNLRSVFDVGQINGIDFISTAHATPISFFAQHQAEGIAPV